MSNPFIKVRSDDTAYINIEDLYSDEFSYMFPPITLRVDYHCDLDRNGDPALTIENVVIITDDLAGLNGTAFGAAMWDLVDESEWIKGTIKREWRENYYHAPAKRGTQEWRDECIESRESLDWPG